MRGLTPPWFDPTHVFCGEIQEQVMALLTRLARRQEVGPRDQVAIHSFNTHMRTLVLE